jgi:hypothetical protein
MSAKFPRFAALAMVLVAAASGCHTIGGGGVGYYDVGGACQKGPCQKGVCQKDCGGCDDGYRGYHLCNAVHSIFWGCGKYDGCGCGEWYLGEWLYDPPDCCDPCDDCYGQYVGPRDCCKRKFIIDPALWILALKHKHCRNDGWYDPCGNWHCYGDGGCCGGCGKGGCGAVYGDEVIGDEFLEGPTPEPFTADGTIEGIPDPTPVPAVRTGRVAISDSQGETRQATHELRR